MNSCCNLQKDNENSFTDHAQAFEGQDVEGIVLGANSQGVLSQKKRKSDLSEIPIHSQTTTNGAMTQN